jgi:beta-phosphoglucomutase-like phosphatase (HAD superfamily)
MLVIFDNDGTLCDTQQAEGGCYELAIEWVTGISLSAPDWARFEERTSSAIIRQLLADDPDVGRKELRIRDEFCRLLQSASSDYPGDFSPIPGAIEFLGRLRQQGVAIAIATGGFDTEARFKLACCEIALENYPHATASDTAKRKDIIQLAASRAGFELGSVVYFGDAPWDVRVSTELGIHMIGIGRRHELLREMGVRFSFRDYSEPEAILTALTCIRAEMPNNALQPTREDARA